MKKNPSTFYFIFLLAIIISFSACDENNDGTDDIPEEILQIFEKPLYSQAVWGLRVEDAETGELIYDLQSNRDFLIGSVRKLYSVGVYLNEVGSEHLFVTPVHRQGNVNEAGVLDGDLILVAEGDLTMGGRRNPDGTMAITDFDHNEANSLGNAELTEPNPLWGYGSLAKQVFDSGITEINGEIIIDDRLFEPFEFRDENWDVRPIFINDDVVDVIMNPTEPVDPASVDYRPKSSAFEVVSGLLTAGAGVGENVLLSPEEPECIGEENCTGSVTGELPVDFIPPLTDSFPLIQTFRITEPSNYARTVFIEELVKAGVTVNADAIGLNPEESLPPVNSYTEDTKVAELISLPYSEYAKLILKVSYNIGADTSLVLYGLTQGVNNIESSLDVERTTLTEDFGINGNDFDFVDGSGGGFTTAKNKATTKFLEDMIQKAVFPEYFDALPILAEDGSLAFISDFLSDPTLAGAAGNVRAKTGTFIEGLDPNPPDFRAQALAGYIDAKSGRRLIFSIVVNDVGPIMSLDPVLETFQDQGTISAIIWRDN